MCTLSMVHDHYNDPLNDWMRRTSWPPIQPQSIPPAPAVPTINFPAITLTREDIDRLAALLAEFKEAVAAATKLDALLKQADCVDPEKAKLQETVARLERVVDALTGSKS
jgi:hypothetical protein